MEDRSKRDYSHIQNDNSDIMHEVAGIRSKPVKKKVCLITKQTLVIRQYQFLKCEELILSDNQDALHVSMGMNVSDTDKATMCDDENDCDVPTKKKKDKKKKDKGSVQKQATSDMEMDDSVNNSITACDENGCDVAIKKKNKKKSKGLVQSHYPPIVGMDDGVDNNAMVCDEKACDMPTKKKRKDNKNKEKASVQQPLECDIEMDDSINDNTVCDEKACDMPAKKKKDKRKKEKLSVQKQVATTGNAGPQAIEYLRKWLNDRDSWHFMKVRQVWLLNNMYDTTKMDDAHFHIMLKYIDGMKGFARKVTVEKAEKVIASADSSEGNGEDEDTEKDKGAEMDPCQLQRVKDVLQVLG